MIKNRKREFCDCMCGFVCFGFLVLVSAPNVVSDTGTNTTIKDNDGTTFNIAATPHRISANDSIGYVQVNITTNKDTNKSFTLTSSSSSSSSSSSESHMELKDNNTVSLNTNSFNVPSNGLNKYITSPIMKTMRVLV